MNNETITQLKTLNNNIYVELQTIFSLVLLNENKKIDLIELKKLIDDYSKISTMSYLECLILFRIDIYKGKSYEETFNKFLYNK